MKHHAQLQPVVLDHSDQNRVLYSFKMSLLQRLKILDHPPRCITYNIERWKKSATWFQNYFRENSLKMVLGLILPRGQFLRPSCDIAKINGTKKPPFVLLTLQKSHLSGKKVHFFSEINNPFFIFSKVSSKPIPKLMKCLRHISHI